MESNADFLGYFLQDGGSDNEEFEGFVVENRKTKIAQSMLKQTWRETCYSKTGR